MHHKRHRPKQQRSGCLCCKSHKGNGQNGSGLKGSVHAGILPASLLRLRERARAVAYRDGCCKAPDCPVPSDWLEA